LHDVGEVGIEEQVVQVGIALVGFHDSIQKFAPNNASPAPDGRDIAEVQVPIELLARSRLTIPSPERRRRSSRRKSASRTAVNEFIAVAAEFSIFGCGQDFRGFDTLLLREEMTRASTAALIVEMTIDCRMAIAGSRCRCLSGRPLSRMTSTIGLPVSGSCLRKIWDVMSIK
jgi:hypothetical protein